jgi:predicted patatin/cPLA2 family phospholipase
MDYDRVLHLEGELAMQLLDHLRACRELPIEERPALVVQGGALRGVYSVGALSTLEELDLRESFSFVIGSSAGACNGAYFLCKQAYDGMRIYIDELSSPDFVSFKRLGKIVDIDFLVDVAVNERHPMNMTELRRCPVPLYTVLTDADSGMEHIVSSHSDELDPREVIRATAAIPGLYNRKVKLGDGEYVDGGIANQVPLAEAFAHGAREVLVVLTRERGYRRNGHGLGYRLLSRAMARGQSKAVKRRLGVADPDYNTAMALLEDEQAGPGRRTWTVWPSDTTLLVERTTADKARLQACADMGREDMLRLLKEEYTAPGDPAAS